MTISGISSSNCATMINQYGCTAQSCTANRQNPVDGNRPAEPPPGGGLIDAIMESLSQIGVGQTSEANNGSSATSDQSSTAQNAVQAFGSFMQNLMGALHSQSAGGGQPPGPPPGGGGGPQGPGGAGGPQQMESDLESLIKQLSSSDSSTSSSSTASASDSSSTSQSDLESSYSALVSALGGSSGSASLESFLETLASKLQSNGPSGNVINTHA